MTQRPVSRLQQLSQHGRISREANPNKPLPRREVKGPQVSGQSGGGSRLSRQAAEANMTEVANHLRMMAQKPESVSLNNCDPEVFAKISADLYARCQDGEFQSMEDVLAYCKLAAQDQISFDGENPWEAFNFNPVDEADEDKLREYVRAGEKVSWGELRIRREICLYLKVPFTTDASQAA